MDYLISIFLEILKFIKEKGYIAELIEWAEAEAAKSESPIDDVAVKILKFFLA